MLIRYSSLDLVSVANSLNLQRTTINELENEVVLGRQEIESLRNVLNGDNGGRRKRRNLGLLQEQRNTFARAAKAVNNRNVLLMVLLKADLVRLRRELSAFIKQVVTNTAGLDIPALVSMAEEAIDMADNVIVVAKLKIAAIENEYQIIIQVVGNGNSIPTLPPLIKPTTTSSVSPAASTTPCSIRRPYCGWFILILSFFYEEFYNLLNETTEVS